MVFTPQSVTRNQEQRIGKILSSTPSTQTIVMADKYGGQFYVSMHVHDTMASMPAVGETWMVKRMGIDWVLDKRLDDGTEHVSMTDLMPGDRRIYAPNDIYMSGNNLNIYNENVLISGSTSISGSLSVQGPITFNNPLRPSNIGSGVEGQVLFTTNDETTWGNLPAVVTEVPVASIIMTALPSSVPTGWLGCSGTAVSQVTYSSLFSAIGTTYGSPTISGTFILPNLTPIVASYSPIKFMIKH
jgi:hypothetical protein